MKKPTITAAPQALVTDSLYEEWLETHTGTMEDFIAFLCSPTESRTEFLISREPTIDISEGVGTATY